MREVRFDGEGSGMPDLDCPRPSDLGPPPGAPIRTAWIAGRVALAFVDESGGAQGELEHGGLAGLSLTSLEALDVEQRPYIWDL